MFNQSLINRRSQLQCIINNEANTEHRKTKTLQQMINTANTAYKILKCNITTNRRPAVHVNVEVGCSEQIVNCAAAVCEQATKKSASAQNSN